ncbi:zinc finger protein 510-like isoform X2 [Ambystoma mexicanum]|uniref:zinc finger protein 510-like isoform X2 n=1 Tax=Ambystoma mexicanum TaxID=8296 RepID=UPI0037E767CA
MVWASEMRKKGQTPHPSHFTFHLAFIIFLTESSEHFLRGNAHYNQREMTWQESTKSPFSLPDVANCFPDDEWKMLHEWQKELYKNVMKEIHQALISLGPIIATTVFSLTAKEKEALRYLDHEDPEGRHSAKQSESVTIGSNEMFIINQDKNQYCLDSSNADRRESIDDCHSGGTTSFNTRRKNSAPKRVSARCRDASPGLRSVGAEGIPPVAPFNINDQGGSYSKDSKKKKRQGNLGNLFKTSAFSQHLHEEKDEGGSDAENLFMTSAFAQHLHEERDDEDSEPGDETMYKREKFVKSQKSAGNKTQCKDPSRDIKTNQPESPEMGTSDGNQAWTQNNEEVEPNNGDQLTYPQREGNPTFKKYMCSICSKCFIRKRNLLRHQRAHAGIRYDCSECEKSFSQKSDLAVHQRIHAENNPYTCDYCNKSFSSKSNLNHHKRKHPFMYPGHFYNMT